MSKTFKTPASLLTRVVPRRVIAPLALVSVLVLATVGLAGVPQPDAICYGSLTINGRLITASDDVSVIGRVPGVPQPVGRYRMGDGATAGDNYVLRVRIEAPVTGSPQSPNAALLGQRLSVYVKQANNPEVLAVEVTLTTLGMLQQRNLSVSILPANCVADSVVDLADYQAFENCMTAPGETATLGCSCADVDGDGDVDMRDWAWLQIGFTG